MAIVAVGPARTIDRDVGASSCAVLASPPDYNPQRTVASVARRPSPQKAEGTGGSAWHPLGPWPLWLWLGAAACGFAAPSWQLASRLRKRRQAILHELPVALDLFVIAASAGLSPEQALHEASRRLEGVLGSALREVVREAGLGTAADAEGLALLAEREQGAELRSLASAWTLAHQQGLPLAPALTSLSETVRDRRRAALVEAGGRASVRMLFPVALFIFPVFLVVLLYPAGVELLGLGG